MLGSKAEFKRLMPVVRDMWNDFDPIGLGTNDLELDGEYDSYMPQTIRLMLEGADRFKLEKHIQNCVWVDMGMAGLLKEEISGFAERLAKVRV